MHFFVTYEGKEFETPQTVTLGQGHRPTPMPASWPCLGVRSARRSTKTCTSARSTGRSSDDHLLELSGKVRKESEIQRARRPEHGSYASTKDNEETRIDLR